MPNLNKLILSLICLMLGTWVLKGQIVENGEEKMGAWYMYFGTHRISNPFSIHSEVQVRLFELTDTFNQLLLRTGLNYHLNSNSTATLGYGYIKTDGTFLEQDGARDSREHRIFEQFILKNTLGKVAFEHRYRLEQRFIDSGNNTETQHRARYRLQCTVPLAKRLYLNFYDEIFLNLQADPFGQNRAYAALGIRVSPGIDLQLGYLKNHFRAAHFDRLQIGIFYSIDHRKEKAVGAAPSTGISQAPTRG